MISLSRFTLLRAQVITVIATIGVAAPILAASPDTADLRVSRAATPNPAVTGQTVSVTVTVSNAGPNAATEVWLTNWLPAEFALAGPLPTNCTLVDTVRRPGNPAGVPVSFGESNQVNLGTGLNSPHSVVASDVDGDGRVDLVTASWKEGRLAVLRNVSRPGSLSGASFVVVTNFAIPTGIDDRAALAVADLDGDGWPDVVVNGRAVLRNVSQPGQVAFGPPLLLNPPAPFSTYNVRVADLNCDGRPDIVASDIPHSQILLWENVSQRGTLAFGPVRFLVPASGSPIAFAIGDLDGDGRPDLVTGDALGSGRVDVYLNRTPRGGALTDAAFAPAFSLTLLPTLRLSKVSLADVDGDGRPDVLVTGHATSNGDVFSNGTLAVFRQTAAASFDAGSFLAPQTFAAGNYVSTMEVADFNGDGKLDMVLLDTAYGNWRIFENASSGANVSLTNVSSGVFAVTNRLTVPESQVALADFDRDGQADIAVANSALGVVTLFPNQAVRRVECNLGAINPGGSASLNLVLAGLSPARAALTASVGGSESETLADDNLASVELTVGACGPTPLCLRREGNQLLLSWPNPVFRLQASTSLGAGSWVDVVGAASPATLPLGGAGGGYRFFRLVCP